MSDISSSGIHFSSTSKPWFSVILASFSCPLVWRDDLERDGGFAWTFAGGFAEVDRVSLFVVGEVVVVGVAKDGPLPEKWTRKGQDLDRLRCSSLKGISMLQYRHVVRSSPGT